MSDRHKQKIFDKPFIKLLQLPFTALLAFLAVLIGIQTGNFLYKLDVKPIKGIDTENFKNTINFSLPIIETIYNSGKSSVSFSGEIKNLFTKVFEFDLDSPITILNVQSPLFMSYYNHQYKSLLALEGGTQPSNIQDRLGVGDDSNSGGTGTGKGTGGTDAGTGLDGKDGQDSNDGQNGENGKVGQGLGNNEAGSNDTETGEGKGTGEGNTAPGMQKADGSGQAAKPGDSVNAPEKTTTPQTNNSGGLQPISSIAYKVEDEEEGEKGDTVALDKIVVHNYTKHKIDIAKLLREPLKLTFNKMGPKVLIYHTHTTESYVLKAQDLGKKSVASFNANPKYNVVRVGEELARYLKKYGIETIHNGTVHDKKRDAAYGVSINTLQSYMKSYPSIKVFIDIHRDGLDASKPKLRMVKKINGKDAAQIMFVMGTNDLLPHSKWEENLKFALKVQQKLNEKYPGLARPVWIVSKRYNQHVSNQAVLIEVGGDGNLLSECIESTKYLAEVLNEVIKGK